MKKSLLFITYCTLFIFPSISFANWGNSCDGFTCPVESNSAQVIDDYIQNIRKVVSNVTNELSSTQEADLERVDQSIQKDVNDMRRILNEMIHWDWFYSSFEYHVVFPIKNELPWEFQRDHKRMEKEIAWLNKYLSRIVKRWYGSTPIENACQGISDECKLSWTAMDIIWELLQNTTSLTDLYRKTILWKNTSQHKNIIFTGKDFKIFRLELVKNYWANALQSCSCWNQWFFATIAEAITNINFKNEQWEGWVAKWKEAWDLLIGAKSDREYYLKEKELLEKNLGKFGLSGSQQQQILRNHENYYRNGGFTKDNNPLSNTFNDLAESISSQWNTFTETIEEAFPQEEEEVSIDEFSSNQNENNISLQIQKNIEEVYNKELPFVEVEYENADDVRLRLIRLHSNLSQSINVMQDTIKLSQKVCNKQDTGNWICN